MALRIGSHRGRTALIDVFPADPISVRLRARCRVTKRGCWEWTGATDPAGYGAVIRHRCNNPRCIRPAHLRPGTRSENLTDAKIAGRDCRKGKLGLEVAAVILADPRPAAEVAATFEVAISTVYKIRSWCSGI